MRRFPTTICAVVLVAAMAATAAAEKTVAVNDPAVPGVFDQPSAVASGSVVHVAYIGADNTAGPFRVYYAAINGDSDFTNLSLSRTTAGFLVTPPTVVDNTAPGNDAYVDARHPRIAIQSDTEVVIFFQAKTAASPDPAYVLYLARLTLESGVVVQQSVRMVTGVSGFTEDVSFVLFTSDDTARVAYAGRPGISGDFNVYYARISLDTAAVTGTPGTPLLLSSATGTTGTRPLPSLGLDSSTRSHISWAANDNSSSPNGIYYALVKETDGADTVAIAATELLGRSRKWGFPSTLVSSTSSVIILASDESVPGTAGNIGLVNINPDADDQDGSPVQVTTDTDFLLNPPGEAILTESFSLYRPETFLDSLERIKITGYGNNGTRSTYYDFALTSIFPFAQFVNNPTTVGLDSSEFPASLTGDYTRAAFGFLTGGKVVIFWSGEVAGTGNRNLDVTGLPTASAIETDESGCGVVAKSRAGGAGRNADGLFLVLPVAFLWMRRVLRRNLGG
jgi:hypothetical protein